MKKFILLSIISTTIMVSCKKAASDIKATGPANATTTGSTATGTSTSTQRLVARFSYSAPDPINIFEYQPVTFTNESMGAVSCVWEFGNAKKSSDKDPVISYPWHGYYTVKLTVFDAHGNSQSVTHDVSILCLYANGVHPTGGTSANG